MTRYHVVCHDCEFEDVVDDETEAEADVEEHRQTEGHDVECRRVD
mgnify:CR=1 FL=1